MTDQNSVAFDGGYSLSRRMLLASGSAIALMPWGVRAQAVNGYRHILPMPDDAWPQRRLLEAPEGASWDASLLAKPVEATVQLNEFSNAANWTAGAPATISADESSFAILRLRSPLMDPALLNVPASARRRKGSTSYFKEGGGAVYWRHSIKNGGDWSSFNRLKLQIRPKPNGLSAYRIILAFRSDEAGGQPNDPMPFHFLPNLIPGVWNDVVWEFPELPRQRVSEFAILMPLVGPQGAQAEYEVTGFELQRTQPEHVYGWNVDPIRIACNHNGYDIDGPKIAFAAHGPDIFSLVEVGTFRTVRYFEAKIVTTKIGTFSILEFSEFSESGQYFLKYGKAKSPPFHLVNDCRINLVYPLLNFFYADRCGHAVHGVHGVCHSELYAEHGAKLHLINGGWHDAGNLCQGAYRTALGVGSLIDAYSLAGLKLPKAMQDRLLEEACWGLDWLMKSRFGKGFRVGNAAFTIMQDGILSNDDEIVVQTDNPVFEGLLFATVASRSSNALKLIDPVRSKHALLAAEEDYAAAIEQLLVVLDRLPEGPNLPAPHEVVAHAIIASMSLHAATGVSKYADQAKTLAAQLFQYQDRRISSKHGVAGYYCRDRDLQRSVIETHTSFADSPAQAFSMLCEAFPNHPDWIKWYAAVAIEGECFFKRGAELTAPFNYVPTAVWKPADIEPYIARSKAMIPFAEAFGAPDFLPSPNEGDLRDALDNEVSSGFDLGDSAFLRTFPIAEDRVFHGGGMIQLSRALALAIGARLRFNGALRELACQQLDWHFGLNPFAKSLVYGVGQDFASQMLVWAQDLVGAVPVGMDSRYDRPFWPHTCHMTSREMWIVPAARMLSLVAVLNSKVTSPAAVELAVTRHNDDVAIVARGNILENRDFSMIGHNINLVSVANGIESTWRGQIIDPSRAWLVCLRDGDGRVITDYVG